MLFFSAISALILLESRDVVNGLLSQPFAAVLLLVFSGFDPVSVFLTASAVQLIYLNRQPSGASLFPEYPFAFFLVSSAGPSEPYSAADYAAVIFLIILVSASTSYFFKLKRVMFEKYRDVLIFSGRVPGIIKVLFYSYLLYAVYSLSLFFLLQSIMGTVRYIPDTLMVMRDGRIVPVSICFVLSLLYLIYNARSKNE